jgi:fumarylpyruvate hydrolase
MLLMSVYLFPPPELSARPIRGSRALFPVCRIFCVGRNYEAHAREMGSTADRSAPFYFTKAAFHCTPSGATVPYVSGTGNLHHEIELVAAIGTAGFRIAEADALKHVFGYACGFDMTRRDLQEAAKQQQRPWDVGKDFEHSAVLSEIVAADECGHIVAGEIGLRLNGEVKQLADVSELVHPVAALVSDLSRYYHLQAGDLIYTGTPAGVGPVQPGDRIEGWVAGVGAVTLNIALESE